VQSGKRIAIFRIGRIVVQIIADVRFLVRRPSNFTEIILLSICAQLFGLVLIWLILRDLGANVSFVDVVVVAPVVLILLVLPISVAGWGLREGLFVLGFGLLNVPEDVALAASIVYGLINLVASLIGGVFWIAEPTRSRQSKPHTSAGPSLTDVPMEKV
jgi:glycosyltransferase 2 family protein